LNRSLGKKGIDFLKTNNVPFVIVWSGYVTSTTSSDNMSINYNFIGMNTNPIGTHLMIHIDDGSGLVLNNMNNSILKKTLFKNKKYPIHIIYISGSYSSSNNISLTIVNNENNPIEFSYLKENDQVYDPHKYYFGMVKENTLYRFYTIYDSTINIVIKAIKYMMSIPSVPPKYVDAGTINGITLKAAIPNTTTLPPTAIVILTELDTNFRTNKQFYVNEYDKKMKLVPQNASFLAQHPTKPYLYAGNFAPSKYLTLNTENSKETDINGCKQFCKEKNCTSFYSYVQSVKYNTTETKEEKYQVDVSNVIQIPTLVSSSKSYNTSDFNFDKNKYNYVPLVKSRQIYEMKNKPQTVWSKQTRTRQVSQEVTKMKNVNKCILNNDINQTNLVPLNKMNTIQPDDPEPIKSSKLYIQNKHFVMDSTNMPEYVKSRNGFTFYNINDPSNFTQGFDYDGTMNRPMPIGRQSLEPVQQTIQSQMDLVTRLIGNKMDPRKISENFSTKEGMAGDYDGIIATSNSILNQLYTINNINLDISRNLTEISGLYLDLSGNCKGTSEEIKRCIKYKFSNDPKADITKKITDKNDAYHEDLTEVQLQQNNTFVLGAITTASLLIFAIMMARE
jgi:hypothetical protein